VSDPPVLLVHGFGTSFESTWRHNGWVDLLEDADRSVIGVDLLGHGSAPKPTDPEAYRDLEERILLELPDRPVDAIGFSAGGVALLWLAANYPDRFRRLVVAGVGRGSLNDADERRLEIVEAVRSGLARTPELRYFADLPEASGQGEHVREALTAFLSRPDRRTLSPEILARIVVPVLVVLGDQDFAGPALPLVEALPSGNYQELRGVDHFATPKDFGFLDAALRFLDIDAF